MKCIIMANGEYGEFDDYKCIIQDAELIICADGGANRAYEMGVIPSYIIGDMDSISPEVREYFLSKNVRFKKYPRRKDFTDCQLALALADEIGAEQIYLLGSLGQRLDHTLSNLYAGIELSEKGKKIVHYQPDCQAYLISQEMILRGNKGDIVSVMALSEEARGVLEEGFDYPLDNVVLEKKNPYAISNILSSEKGRIKVEQGILLVLHYPVKLLPGKPGVPDTYK